MSNPQVTAFHLAGMLGFLVAVPDVFAPFDVAYQGDGFTFHGTAGFERPAATADQVLRLVQVLGGSPVLLVVSAQSDDAWVRLDPSDVFGRCTVFGPADVLETAFPGIHVRFRAEGAGA